MTEIITADSIINLIRSKQQSLPPDPDLVAQIFLPEGARTTSRGVDETTLAFSRQDEFSATRRENYFSRQDNDENYENANTGLEHCSGARTTSRGNSDLGARTTSRAREQLKNKRIEEEKELISRLTDGEDQVNSLSAGIEDFVTSSSTQIDTVVGDLDLDAEQTDSRELTSRVDNQITGANAQHVKTDKGTKITFTLQTQEDSVEGLAIKITAELKHHSRLREVKPIEDDSDPFKLSLTTARKDLLEMDKDSRKYVAMGRAHTTGKRDAWVTDVFVICIFDDNKTAKQVVLYYGEEQIIIEMNDPLTSAQMPLYYSSGHYGEMVKKNKSKSLWSMKRVQL